MKSQALVFTSALLLVLIAAQPTSRKSSEEDGRKCRPCRPGWGMVEPCYDSLPTLCKPCPRGTYSPRHPHHKACTPCSRCGKGLYVDQKCTSIHDTVCDTCSTTEGRFNEDYIRKCILSGELEKLAYKDLSESPAKLTPFGGLSLFDDSNADDSRDIFSKLELDPDTKTLLADFEDILNLDDDPQHHFREWDGDQYVSHQPVNFFPAKSEESYPYSVKSALSSQRQKLYLLLAVTSVVLLCTLLMVCLVVYFWRQRVATDKLRSPDAKSSYLQDHLREHDLLLIQGCAARLERPSPDVKLRQVSQTGVHAFENPLERLLEDEEEFAKSCSAEQ